MTIIKKINDDLAVAGQIKLEQLMELVEAGYKSVLNLQAPDEAGVLEDEAQKVEALGLYYAQIPTQGKLQAEVVLPVLKKLIELPKPLLLHCDNGTQSAAIGFVYIAMKHGATLDQAIVRARSINLVKSSLGIKRD